MDSTFPNIPIGTVARVRSGYAFKSSDWMTIGCPVVKIANVKEGSILLDGCSYVSDEIAKEAAEFYLKDRDILIAMTGYIGDTAWVRGNAGYLLNQRVGRFNILDAARLQDRFLFYVLRCPEIRQEIENLGYGSAQPNISPSLIHGVQIPFPPLPVQVLISSALGALDDKIELNRRMNQTLEALAAAIFKAWFIDFEPVKAKAAGAKSFPSMPQPVFDALPSSLVLAPNSPSGEIPSGWEMRTVGDLADLNVQTLGKSDQLQVIDYIEISEVNRGEVGTVARYSRGEEPSRARRRLRHGDSVVSTVRPDRGSHFLCLNPAESLVASTGFAVLSSRSGCWAHLYAGLTQPEVGEELGRLADGGAYPAVRPEVVAGLSLPHPNDHAVVQAFQDIAEPLFLLADQNRQENRTLAALRDTLLPKLLSGEVRVTGCETAEGTADHA